jgi:NAD(P)-dependent dehydrogenase (short-subunit alcohol dehydrogenase family)
MACPFALTKDGIETQFGTNHVGHFLFTTKLIPALLKSNAPRIVNLSSYGHNFAPPEGIKFDKINDPNAMSTWARYGQSKLANILFSHGLDKRFGDKFFVSSVHPGVVRSQLTRGPKETLKINSYLFFLQPLVSLSEWMFSISTPEGALTSLYAAASPEIEEKNIRNAYLVAIAKESETSELGKDKELAEKLWDYSEKLVAEKLAV